MAIQTITPHPAPADLLSLKEISDLLRQTGHPASVSTIRRWVSTQDLYLEYHRHYGRRYAYASFTDILEAHHDWVAGQA